MTDKKVLKLVISAMFASLVCVATMVIKIPTPTNGYVNIGDCVVLLSGWLLGPVYGVLSAAIGSMMADIFSGYPVYAVATFIIKGVVALIAWVIFGRHKKSILRAVISAICAELFMAIAYFVFEWILMGQGIAALAGMPANLLQGLVGIVLALILLKIFTGNKTLADFFDIYLRKNK